MTRAEVEAEQDNVEVRTDGRACTHLAWPPPFWRICGHQSILTPRNPHLQKHDINQPKDQTKKGQTEPLCTLSCKVIWESFKQ